jgi:tetratricopeptide (TPR) repeat protein
MKRKIILPFFLLASGWVIAQNVNDAKQAMYYERYKTAENTLHAVIKNEPANAEAWYLLSQAYLQQDKLNNIHDSLLAAPADAKSQPYYQVAYGNVLLLQKKKDSAQILFNEALSRTKQKDAAILSAVAKAYVDAPAEDVGYAVELLNKAINRDKNNAALYVLLGDAYRKQQNGSEAYKAYTQALSKNNRYAPASFKLGKIFQSQRNPDMYLKYYNDALTADAAYAPAYYQLYNHYYTTDAGKAMDYLKSYIANSDKNSYNDFLVTDMLYLTKDYSAAIKNANEILSRTDTVPRLYKLLAYSYQGLKDTGSAVVYMNQYFAKAPDSVKISKDFLNMGELYAAINGKEDSSAFYYGRAAELEPDSVVRFALYKKVADFYKGIKDYSNQAKWLGQYSSESSKATNVDMFNWGLAHFRAEEYQQADSVFGLYTKEYPEQGFGFYWRARSNALLDPKMEQGLAIPYYKQLAIIAEKSKDDETNKKWLVEAYGYLAAYETNHEKDYATAIDYFQKLLEVNPDNADAKKYIDILQKNVVNRNAKSELK